MEHMRPEKNFLKGVMLLIVSLALCPLFAINQSAIVDQGVELHDEEKYTEAIALFLTVDENDSSYVRMISELSLTYNAVENYDSAIICCRRGLEELSSYKNNLYSVMASAYDMKGEVDSAIFYYEKALSIEPYNSLDHFNLGVTYYNSKQCEKALSSFQEALRCDPFHKSSHLYLGILAARQNQLTKAMLSLETFLMLEPNSGRSNKFLIFLNNLSQNYVDTVYGEMLEPFSDNTPYEYTDRLIRSRVVLVDEFETIIDFNAPVVKQTQVLFDKLPKIRVDEFWSELYWGFFTAIKENAYIEPMLCTILRSAGSEVVDKWVEKNDKLVSEFYNVGSELATIKNYRYLDLDGELKRYTVEYDNGYLSSVGRYEDKKQVGYWQYFWSHGGLKSEGEIEQDEKTGQWKYYTWEGTLDFVTEMKQGKNNGPAKKFYSSEKPRYSLGYKDNDPDGEVRFYSKSGQLTETSIFVAGLREGKAVRFYGTGDTSSVYSYKEGKISGSNVNYHSDGSVQETSFYSDGLLEGDFVSYHYGGHIESTGSYKMGNRTGEWIVYFEDGALSQHLLYNDTAITGERRDYYKSGQMNTLYRYNGKGELDGDIEYFTREGKVYLIETYVADKIIGVKSFNASSELIGEYSSGEGNFSFKSYYVSGRVKLEGQFANGLETGEWTTYWLNGNVKKQQNYSEGVLIGEAKTFYKNGQLQDLTSKKSAGIYDEYTSYYINGQVKTQGLMLDGRNLHHWFFYRIDGSLLQKSYFVDDQIDGWLTGYTVDGKILSRSKYEEGTDVIQEWYNESGELIQKRDNREVKELKITLESGQTIMKAGYSNFKVEDTLTWFYSNGLVSAKYHFENNLKQGDYSSWSREGQLDGKGKYWNGEKVGQWLWYYDNGKVLSGEYYYVNGERDSIQKYYNEEGGLIKELDYQNGSKHGAQVWYSDAGTAMIRLNYWLGELVSYQQPLTKGWGVEILIASGDEKIASHYVGGQLAFEVQLKDFLYEGVLLTYTDSGDISRKMPYSKGLKNGISENYYASGQIESKEVYLWGEYNGESVWYYANGQVKKKRNYYLGDAHGTSYYYTPKGELESSDVSFGGRLMRLGKED